MKLQGKTALITGGGQGLGRAIALRLAREGAAVAVLGPEIDPLQEAAGQIDQQGGRALPLQADVRREGQVKRAVEQTRHQLGPIDILVNNAGIAGPAAPVDQMPLDEWNDVLAVNLTGPFLCCRCVVPDMMARRQGRIINISSVAGKQAYPLRSPYAASKWGLIGLTLTLAKELGPYQILVNAVCPGPVEGPRMDEVIRQRAARLGEDPEQVRQQYRDATALGRMVQQEDVAALVAFLAGPEAAAITGQAIDVSAGYGL